MLAIIKDWYCLELKQTPPIIPPKPQKMAKEHLTHLQEDVLSLLQKGDNRNSTLTTSGTQSVLPVFSYSQKGQNIKAYPRTQATKPVHLLRTLSHATTTRGNTSICYSKEIS